MAAARLAGLVRHTPLLQSEYLSDVVGRPVYLKLENLQITGSFKVRGALSALSALAPTAQRQGVITASAGNHGLGVAWAARHLDIAATVVVPETAVATKVVGLRALGARVVLHGEIYDDAHREALRLARDEDLHYVHAFSDRAVIAGQGTVALEVIADLPNVSCLLIPVGGGGLIGGNALAVAASGRSVRLIGVQTEHAAAMARSLAAGAVSEDESFLPTLADGLAGGAVDPLTLSLCLRYVHQIALASEDHLIQAMNVLLRHDHVVAEPSGAVGVAVLLHGRADLPPDGPVVVVISGGNVDPHVLIQALQVTT